MLNKCTNGDVKPGCIKFTYDFLVNDLSNQYRKQIIYSLTWSHWFIVHSCNIALINTQTFLSVTWVNSFIFPLFVDNFYNSYPRSFLRKPLYCILISHWPKNKCSCVPPEVWSIFLDLDSPTNLKFYELLPEVSMVLQSKIDVLDGQNLIQIHNS